MTGEKKKSDKKETRQPAFEESMQRLEEIIAAMESGRLDLDQMIAHFEEGSALVKSCTRKLDEVERRIEILVKKDQGIVAEPFDADQPLQGEGPGGAEG